VFTLGNDGNMMHCGTKRQWIERDALGNVLLGNPGSANHMDVNLTHATNINIVADQVHPFMTMVFPDGSSSFS